MGIDYPTAFWIYRDLGFRAYEVKSVEDLYNPFISMYFESPTILGFPNMKEGECLSYPKWNFTARYKCF
ncbi:hypothetical protein HPP92_016689 [Vanilla planifolia]|uniref:Uncharacterized protein n=1 Tax=Vanilla planifolia TaxID=51239 RepID=A0A835UNP7_VANPL|nr:hypothetical protein HPP92_016689 [Vanilla planifolia]